MRHCACRSAMLHEQSSSWRAPAPRYFRRASQCRGRWGWSDLTNSSEYAVRYARSIVAPACDHEAAARERGARARRFQRRLRRHGRLSTFLLGHGRLGIPVCRLRSVGISVAFLRRPIPAGRAPIVGSRVWRAYYLMGRPVRCALPVDFLGLLPRHPVLRRLGSLTPYQKWLKYL
jgi:hypothetical protein